MASRVSSGTGSLNPTYFGHVATTNDALILFEACLQGQLHHVPRRPHDRERGALIRSGCVFIYEENASGIKRWTDGVAWSPSRILGNFLVYRELEKPFPPGEKKKATKRDKRLTKPGEPYPSPRSNVEGGDGSLQPYSPMSPTSPVPKSETFDKETERSLIGSLVDSYGFREGGLVKKTMSVNVNGVHHHLVSYYKVEDVLGGLLETPSMASAHRYIKPRLELTSRQNFRAPIDDSDEIRDSPLDGSQIYNYQSSGSFDRRTLNGQSYQLPQPQPQPPPPQIGYSYPGADHFSPYGSDTHQASSVPSSYGTVVTASSSMSHAYYTQASRNPSHVQIKTEEYSPYSASTPYASTPNRPDPLAVDNGGISTSASGRGIGTLQTMDYTQHQLRPIPMPMESSDALASKPPSSYGRSYQPISTTSPYQSNVPSMAAPRPENTVGYGSDKETYWPGTGNTASGHAHYTGSSSVQHWTSTA